MEAAAATKPGAAEWLQHHYSGDGDSYRYCFKSDLLARLTPLNFQMIDG